MPLLSRISLFIFIFLPSSSCCCLLSSLFTCFFLVMLFFLLLSLLFFSLVLINFVHFSHTHFSFFFILFFSFFFFFFFFFFLSSSPSLSFSSCTPNQLHPPKTPFYGKKIALWHRVQTTYLEIQFHKVWETTFYEHWPPIFRGRTINPSNKEPPSPKMPILIVFCYLHLFLEAQLLETISTGPVKKRAVFQTPHSP